MGHGNFGFLPNDPNDDPELLQRLQELAEEGLRARQRELELDRAALDSFKDRLYERKRIDPEEEKVLDEVAESQLEENQKEAASQGSDHEADEEKRTSKARSFIRRAFNRAAEKEAAGTIIKVAHGTWELIKALIASTAA